MKYIVDVQGFIRPMNVFTFKEVAITALEEDAVPFVYFFKPPYEWNSLSNKYKCANDWLTRNFHGLFWADGEIIYSDVKEVLQSVLKDATKVYVKGLEKKKWMSQLIPNVYNLEDLGCPSLFKLGHPKKWCLSLIHI